MTGEFLTLPLRLSARAASLLLRSTEEIATRGIALATQVAGIVRPPAPQESAPSRETDAPESAPPRERRPAPRPEPQPPALDRTDEIDFDAPPQQEPAHVSEEPELTAELAEPGAEDGAGAQIRIDAPLAGYDQLNADEVIARLAASDPAELAAIQLYESANQRRQTVLSAVERQLALSSRGS